MVNQFGDELRILVDNSIDLVPLRKSVGEYVKTTLQEGSLDLEDVFLYLTREYEQ